MSPMPSCVELTNWDAANGAGSVEDQMPNLCSEVYDTSEQRESSAQTDSSMGNTVMVLAAGTLEL